MATRRRLATAAVICVSLLIGTVIYAEATQPPARPGFKVVRAVDGQELHVGDIVSKLQVEVQSDGVNKCITTRAGTELEMQVPIGDDTTVEEAVDKDCNVVIVYIGPPRETLLPGGVTVDAKPEVDK